MTNTRAIRQLIQDALSDNDLSTLCQDDFPKVYNQFIAGQGKDQRIALLIEHVERQLEVPKLLSAIEQMNPNAHAKFVLDNPSSHSEVNRSESSDKQIGWSIPGSRCRQIFGREDLTRDLLIELKKPEQYPILCLGGVAGYGKTEAAVCVARAAIEQSVFEDVLWIQIRETEFNDNSNTSDFQSELVQWKELIYLLSCQLRCLAEEELVRKCLRSKKWLIVLDNAETSNLNDILPKLVKMLGSSTVLLTSRLVTQFPFVKVVDCPGLSKEWSHKLLLSEAKEKDICVLIDASIDQINRLYQLSCGAPLALHFIVGRVREDRELQPVLDALEEANGAVEIFYRFTLENAWQRISDTSRQFLRYMAEANASVSYKELQNIFSVTLEEGTNARNQLRSWSMILHSGDSNRYDLHPWVRRSVRSNLANKWKPQESMDELNRIAEWFGE
jgi:Effector-associated domain 7/NB-ARC domain